MKRLVLGCMLILACVALVVLAPGCVSQGGTPTTQPSLNDLQTQLDVANEALAAGEVAWEAYTLLGNPTPQQQAEFTKFDNAAQAALVAAQADITAGNTNQFAIDMDAARAALKALRPSNALAAQCVQKNYIAHRSQLRR